MSLAAAVHGPEDAAAAAAALVAGYLLADLGTGVYHWGVDNYGDATTPVFGSQVSAQQHVLRPPLLCSAVTALCGPVGPAAA